MANDQDRPEPLDDAALRRILGDTFGPAMLNPNDGKPKAKKPEVSACCHDPTNTIAVDDLAALVLATMWQKESPNAAKYRLDDAGIKVTVGDVTITLSPMDSLLLAGFIYGMIRQNKQMDTLFWASACKTQAEFTAARLKNELDALLQRKAKTQEQDEL